MSSRWRIQQQVENLVGCTSVEKWGSYQEKFLKFTIDDKNIEGLKGLLIEDTEDLYFKAILSIAEAINALYRGYHSWAVVKLYYSVFYLLRCSLATHGFCFVKINSGIYTIKLTLGENPFRRDAIKFNNELIRGDHKTVICTSIKEFGKGDFFLSNKVNDEFIVYDWLMKMREDVNYRNNQFFEPDEYIFSPDIFKKGNLAKQITEYFKEDIYCFLEGHCCLAFPLRLAARTSKELQENFNFISLSDKKKKVIMELLIGTSIETDINMRKIMLL